MSSPLMTSPHGFEAETEERGGLIRLTRTEASVLIFYAT
jgi:hypothetical protein